MVRSSLQVVVLTLVSVPLFAQQTPPAKADSSLTATIPVAEAQKVNPIKPTADSIARGKRLYGYDCAMCHGKPGDGKGDVAIDMKLTMSDFTNPATLKGRTDGELYYIIKNGRGQMPPEGDRGNPKLLWDMVNYVRWLSNQKAVLPAEPKADNADEAKPDAPAEQKK
jgi:mono/diheme cytochrome c family protein